MTISTTAELTAQAGQVAHDLAHRGVARAQLTDAASARLAAAFAAGGDYFARPDEQKLRNASACRTFGYRPPGQEYGETEDRPDLNESFTYWHDRDDLVPHSDEIPELMTALAGWRDEVAPLVEHVIDQLAQVYDGQPFAFRNASHLQMNGYTDDVTERDLAQDLHEDAHLITVHYANAPGLEVQVDGETVPVETDPHSVLLFAGSILTELTDGDIAPLYHRVRQTHDPSRRSLMYFVNPSLNEPVHPWRGRSSDLRDQIRSNPERFGLSTVPEL